MSHNVHTLLTLLTLPAMYAVLTLFTCVQVFTVLTVVRIANSAGIVRIVHSVHSCIQMYTGAYRTGTCPVLVLDMSPLMFFASVHIANSVFTRYRPSGNQLQ